jgi:hypothetical protein
MVICTTLMRLLIDDNFTVEKIRSNVLFQTRYKYILRLVMDNEDSAKGAFSIQNICKMGFANGKFPGEWYGPHAISLMLKVWITIRVYKCIGFE